MANKYKNHPVVELVEAFDMPAEYDTNTEDDYILVFPRNAEERQMVIDCVSDCDYDWVDLEDCIEVQLNK